MIKNKNSIRVIIYKKNRQQVRKVVVPKNDTFSHNAKSYVIDSQNYYIFKNKAVYTYHEDIPTPLTIKDIQVIQGTEVVPYESVLMTADELETFKRAKTAKEILDTVDNKMPENIMSLVSMVVVIGAIGFLWYMLTNQMNELGELIRNLTRLFGVE